MNLEERTHKLLDKYKILPQRQKGQNFLIDEEVLEKIVLAAELKKEDQVLEIGPGLGVLTRELVLCAGRVVSVELDKKLIWAVKKELKEFKNLEILEGDILRFQISDPSASSGQVLRFDPLQLPLGKGEGTKYKLVANLPYNITSIVLRKFLENDNRPELMVLMVQKEVGERVVAEPGEMSLLSLSVQFYATAEIISLVSKNSFWPAPEVDSAIIRIKPFSAEEIKKRLAEDLDEKMFFRIARIGFSARRKQLQNNLANGLKIGNEEIKVILEKLKINPLVRAQDLSVDLWLELAREIYRLLPKE
jgi:16S rRNA (adenine1518-N6/adenine1519-N6)-dimethyltransferase